MSYLCQVFGETVVHLLEVQGFLSLQQDHDSVQEYSPVRYVLLICTYLWNKYDPLSQM